jgi:hypothetical protein
MPSNLTTVLKRSTLRDMRVVLTQFALSPVSQVHTITITCDKSDPREAERLHSKITTLLKEEVLATC